MNWWLICCYAALGLIISVFYAIRGACIVRTVDKKICWWELLHQVWFNFAGSVFGWLVGYWVLQRFLRSPNQVGLSEFLLLVFAALGIVGYLPQTLNAIPGLLEHLSKLASKKFSEPPS